MKKRKNNLKLLIGVVVSIMFFHSCASGQGDAFTVEKKECFFKKKYSGSKLLIHYIKDSIRKSTSPYSYGLDDLVQLPDAKKLEIIDQLLKYENDTTTCCLDVIGRGYNGIEGCRGVPKSKRFNIQIDALFMINRLAWPKITELYSCYNVLVDTLTNEEINNDPKKIKLLFQDYRKWYDECKAKGKIDKYFPFNDGRYAWFGQRKSLYPKE